MSEQSASGLTPSRGIVGVLALVLAGVMATTGADEILPRIAAISALAVALFATRLLPEVATALLCFLAFLATGAATPDIIFSGFASGGFWLLFSGLIIGTAITVTGLGQQIALRIFQRTGSSYRRAVMLLALCGLGLGLLVPSTLPRVIVLMPIALSLSQTMGYAIGSRGHIGLTVTAATATLLPTYAILTANLPTIIHFGAMEALYGTKPSYAQYFIQQAPVNLVRFVVLVSVMLLYAPARAPEAPVLDRPDPLTSVQKLLLALLTLAICLWATDSLHGVAPAWIALSLAAALLIPAFGMLDATAMKTKVDLSPAFFLAAVFAISAVAQSSGLSDLVAGQLLPWLALGQGGALRDLYAVFVGSVVMSHLVTAPAAPVVLAPLAEQMAGGTGWTLETVAMAQVIGIATPVLPYQAPPLIVSMALAQIPARPLVRICGVLAGAVVILGLPITFVWWRFLGVL